MKEDITSLLDKISSINEKYEEISGEKFNIFEELKLTNAEWAHSRILATLLDPDLKASHSKGSLFLKKFLEIVAKKNKTYAKTGEDSKNKFEFSIEGAIVQEEKSIDNGRPDITITNKNGEKIMLENKIWAEEGDNQLERYSKSKEKPIHLIYLTPFGIKAEKIGEGNFNYIKMSYEKDIINWLELCKKESVDNPILRETLTQYILLLRQLTGQTRSEKMKEEVIATIMDNSGKYISAAFDIAGSIEDVKVRIVEKKYLDPLEEFAKASGFEEFTPFFHFQQNAYFRNWNLGINLKKKEWDYLEISLQYIGLGKGFCYGLSSKGVELEKSELKKYMPKIKNEVKEEAKKFGYECCYDNGNKWLLLHKQKNTSFWENWTDTKKFFTEIEMDKMKNDFMNIIVEELSKIGDRLEDKLKEM